MLCEPSPASQAAPALTPRRGHPRRPLLPPTRVPRGAARGGRAGYRPKVLVQDKALAALGAPTTPLQRPRHRRATAECQVGASPAGLPQVGGAGPRQRRAAGAATVLSRVALPRPGDD